MSVHASSVPGEESKFPLGEGCQVRKFMGMGFIIGSKDFLQISLFHRCFSSCWLFLGGRCAGEADGDEGVPEGDDDEDGDDEDGGDGEDGEDGEDGLGVFADASSAAFFRRSCSAAYFFSRS